MFSVTKASTFLSRNFLFYADVVKLADTPDLGSGAARRGGSSPLIRTIISIQTFKDLFSKKY